MHPRIESNVNDVLSCTHMGPQMATATAYGSTNNKEAMTPTVTGPEHLHLRVLGQASGTAWSLRKALMNQHHHHSALHQPGRRKRPLEVAIGNHTIP